MNTTIKKIIKRSIRIGLSPFVINDYMRFKKAYHTQAGVNKGPARFSLSLLDVHPQIKDKTVTTGFDRHYVYHTSWAARIVAELRPTKHIDISSSLYFSGIVSAFVPIEFYDYRPADLKLSNLKSAPGDLMSLPFADDSVSSISCMHTIEHVGLGRYGDLIDPDGDFKAVRELKRVTAPGGSLIFVTPVGETARIEFNAHRIYTYAAVLDMFDGFELKEFALIPERSNKGGLIRHADPALITGETYACGCFHFIKKTDTKKNQKP